MTSTPTFTNKGGHVGPVLVIPAAVQASADALTFLAGSDFDAQLWATIGLTLKVSGNAVTWRVTGANVSDFSDEVVVQADASVAAGATGQFSTFFAAYGYYRVLIRSTAAGTPGTATLNGICKSS